MTTIEELETRLNATTAEGKILEALEEFYADDATFQEGNQPKQTSKAQHREHLTGFFATLKAFNGATLHAQAIGGNIALSEWTFDMVGPEGAILWNEVLRREWKDGKVISERFYTAG